MADEIFSRQESLRAADVLSTWRRTSGSSETMWRITLNLSLRQAKLLEELDG